MTSIELLIVSAAPGLADELRGYDGIQVLSAPTLARASRLLESEHPPQAIYIDSRAGAIDDLWRAARLGIAAGIPVLLGAGAIGAAHAGDLRDAGVAVTDELSAAPLAAWIAHQLGTRQRPAASQITVAVAGAKGGIGKSLVVALLAEGLRRRGVRVLVVDGDLSNSGLVPAFRIPPGFPSYLHIPGDAAGGAADWSATTLRRHIYRHEPSGIDFLLGSEETTDARDLQRSEWVALMQAVGGLTEYDVVLLDTGPEIKKRPYAILAAAGGGWVVLPTPPGRKERAGAGNLLRALQTAVEGRDLTERCLLLFMDPERGASATVARVAPLFARHFPRARALGRLPRCPRHVSAADEAGDRYLSPLDLAPHGRLARSAHQIVEQLCAAVGLRPPLPMPRSSIWQQLQSRWQQPDTAATLSLALAEIGEAPR